MDKNDAVYPEIVGRICAIVELRESGKITIATAYKEIVNLLERVSGNEGL